MEKRNEVRKESGKTGEKGGLIGGKGRKSERRGCRARNSLWSKIEKNTGKIAIQSFTVPLVRA